MYRKFLYSSVNSNLGGSILARSQSILINYAIRAGVAARLERVDKAQISKVLEVLWSSPVEQTIETTILFVLRQRARREIGDLTARLIVEGLVEVKKQAGGDLERAKSLAAEFLGLFKWVYEATPEKVGINGNEVLGLDLDGYLRMLGFRY